MIPDGRFGQRDNPSVQPVQFVLDAPSLPAEPDDKPLVSEHPIAKLGTFKDPRYGKWTWTERDYAEWQRVFASQGSEVLIDYDHGSGRAGGSTKAAGWIKGLKLAGDKVLATIEWTQEGAQAVRDRYWRFVSPEIGPVRDEQNKVVGTGFAAVALTNRPFLREGMPAIALSRELEEQRFVETAPLRDSPSEMPELSKIAETLKLSADATEDQILAKLAEVTKEPETPPETKTLEVQAAESGKVLLSADKFAELAEGANEGKLAAQQLRDQRFEDAYTKALSEGKVVADADGKSETKDTWRGLYDADADKAITLLSTLQPVVRLDGPRGSRGGSDETNLPEQAGFPVDPDSHRILAKAEALAKAEEIDLGAAVVLLEQRGEV